MFEKIFCELMWRFWIEYKGHVKLEFRDPTTSADPSGAHENNHSFPLTYGKLLVHHSLVCDKNDIQEYSTIS